MVSMLIFAYKKLSPIIFDRKSDPYRWITTVCAYIIRGKHNVEQFRIVTIGAMLSLIFDRNILRVSEVIYVYPVSKMRK